MEEPFSFRNGPLLNLKTESSETHEIYSGITLRTEGISRSAFSSMNLGLHVGDRPEDVIANRRHVSKKIGFPLEQWVCAEQVHGTGISRITNDSAGSGAFSLHSVVKGVDGLFTTEPNLLLALCFADCVPIYYQTHHPDSIGIMHAGWRGTVAGGAACMVEYMSHELGIAPSLIHVVIGPSIGSEDYEVDQNVINEVQKLDRSIWKTAVADYGGGRYLLNLKTLNRSILVASGVPENQIQMTGYNTYAHPDLFYSFRRDQGKTGRMLGYIGMKEKENNES
ncbi:peptidoglycan editing factor PgeF [Sporolactobacillus shoreicorticis]|uniref:Purine nucleoside phosphorylase n=1 Tax=Sporolactobacillus shoreicorticis TaxID=1923877 RepID=A0ABW5S932_9BACL|nr:peptidoglycan editing factor PgeF [Sporolactobacillus shoreicorticis]MCO7128105.1 peptidoglycan editing factor PgeF [Sporolactobacillus shoreicorticis]